MGLFDNLFRKRRDAFMGPADRDWRALVPQDVNRVPEGEIGRKRAVRSKLPDACSRWVSSSSSWASSGGPSTNP
jgi:hypothetical protein